MGDVRMLLSGEFPMRTRVASNLNEAPSIRDCPTDVEIAAWLPARGDALVGTTDAPQDRDAILPRPSPGDVWIGGVPYEVGGRLEPRASLDPTRPCDARALWKRVHRLDVGARVPIPRPFRLGTPSPDGDAYRQGVERVLDLIRAGDVYQVNLAHRLVMPFEGCARHLASTLFERVGPAYGVYLEHDHDDETGPTREIVISLSPELFLDVQGAGAGAAVRTRPMKGTRPIDQDPEDLLKSDKDRAELAMIIDLMRNDLGRVASFGSVTVHEPRTLEAHGSVWQTVGEVRATLREGMDREALLRASFPPGSVTGAPKIRAMQIIESLEPEPRGFYTGALGIVEAERMTLNVGIRTLQIRGKPDPDARGVVRGGEATYHVGAGIVADSTPDAEWTETLVKARALEAALHSTDVQTTHSDR